LIGQLENHSDGQVGLRCIVVLPHGDQRGGITRSTLAKSTVVPAVFAMVVAVMVEAFVTGTPSICCTTAMIAFEVTVLAMSSVPVICTEMGATSNRVPG